METNYAIHWIEIYPVDSAIRCLNNLALIFDGYLEFGTVQYYLPNCICIFCQKITCLSQFPEDIPDMQKLVTSMICHAEELFKVYTHN